MKSRFILFNRAGVYYSEDTVTRKQHSLRTKDENEAIVLLNAKNESFRQPVLNMQIARAYLTASDPAITARPCIVPNVVALMAETRLVDSDGVTVALIRRFDRTGEGGRIPYVSAATLLGVEPADAQEHFYTEIVDALRVNGDTPQSDIEELWRRMAFSVLITNVDDHLHNHGFLHVNRGQWRLAPTRICILIIGSPRTHERNLLAMR